MSDSFLQAVIERATAATGSPASQPQPCLLAEIIFTDEDLWSELARFLFEETAALLCATCRCTRSLALRTARLMAAFDGSADSILPPPHGMPWTFERLCLVNRMKEPPLFMPLRGWCIPFDFASDHVEKPQKQTLDYLAGLLSRHPGLRLRIEGHARPSAPAVFGMPLSQARAARVRYELLSRVLQGVWSHDRDGHWASEGDASEGVREGGYSEGEDFDAVVSFYALRTIGTRLQARGMWSPTVISGIYGQRLAQLGCPDGQCAFVSIAGFDECGSDGAAGPISLEAEAE